MRKPPPISTSSPRATMTSLRAASAASARSTAAALLFATSASSEPARSARSRAAWPWRSPRLPRARSYSTLTAPAASMIAASARADSGARPRFVCRTTPVALMTRRSVWRSRSATDARAIAANPAASARTPFERAFARTSRAARVRRSRSPSTGAAARSTASTDGRPRRVSARFAAGRRWRRAVTARSPRAHAGERGSRDFGRE